MTGLRSFIVGLPPSTAAGLTFKAARCCPITASPLFAQARPANKPTTAIRAPSTSFIRTKTNLSDGAHKSANAGTFKTASDLASKHPSANTPPDLQPQSKPANQAPPLDWNSFFKLRMRRRRIQVFFSALSGAGGLFVGAGILGTGLAEPLVSQVPLDPIFTLGGLTIVFAAAGWLVGPTVGGQVFYMLNRNLRPQINQKEAEFFLRIKKHRADPANSSAANPVPDFYGEKIQSVQGYRQWLRDQRAFNKKKTANFV